MEKSDYSFYDRHYNFIMSTAGFFITKKLAFSGEALPDDVGPMFVLCNHNTDFDFLLLASVFDGKLDFVATETMLRMGPVSELVAKKFNPILHDKGSKGTATIKQIVKRIKDGRNVLLFPEGNRSFDGRPGEISPAISKIAKLTGCSLVVYRLTGGYLTTPRWGRGIRKGRMNGRVTAVLSPKEIAEMPADRLQKLIVDSLRTDAYQEQKENPVRFRFGAKAEYLESLLFICPSCKKAGTLRSKGDKVFCDCGYSLTMDDYGYLCDKKGDKLSVAEAFADQSGLLKEMAEKAPEECIWSDDVNVIRLKANHNVVAKEKVLLRTFKDKLLINDVAVTKDRITSIDIVQRNRLIIHVKNSDFRYEITAGKTFNAVKYRIWYEISFA